MPGSASRRGPRGLRPPLRFQVLWVSFEIHADDEAVWEQLRFLVQSATQPESPRVTVTYAARRCAQGFEISRGGVAFDVQFDPVGVFNAVSRATHGDVLAALPERAAVLRAMTGRWQGERFIVVGESLWDRSRLALHLLARGAKIEGDELAFLHDGLLTPCPRPLRVCGPDVPLPDGVPLRDELPFLGIDPATGSWALDLAAAGFEWRIISGPVDRIVLFETNYGGQTRLAPAPAHEAARILMSCCDPRGNTAHAVRSVTALTNGANCCRLWLGAPEDIGAFWPGAWRDTLPARN